MIQSSKVGRISGTACVVVLLALAGYSYRHPAPTFDRFYYAEAAGLPLSSADFGIGRPPLSDDYYFNPRARAEWRPMFAAKPLYVLAVRWLGLRVISPLALLGLGLLLLYWTRSAWSVLILVTPPAWEAAHSMTPDMLGAFTLSLGTFLVVKGKESAGIAVLLSAIWIRPDALFYVGPVLLWLWYAKRLRLHEFAVCTALALLSTSVISHFVQPWRVLLYTAQHRVMMAAENVSPLPWHEYFGLVNSAFHGLLVQLSAPALFAVLAWRKRSELCPFVAFAFVFAVVRTLSDPWAEPRYLVICWLLTMTAVLLPDAHLTAS